MNPERCDEYDCINFLAAAQKSYSCLEAGRVQPDRPRKPAHDAVNRMLTRKEPDAEDLRREAEPPVSKAEGLLPPDDSTSDKLYAEHINSVHRHRSGKRRKAVRGINVLTLLRTDGDKHIPCDRRIYDKPNDRPSWNDRFAALLKTAHSRGFKPTYVCFDSRYGSLANLKSIAAFARYRFTRLKSNRSVNPDRRGNVPIAQVDIGPPGRVVHLKGYGFVKVFRTVSPNGDVEHWAANDPEMREPDRLSAAEKTRAIEHYHRGVKQFCGIEKCRARSATAQRNHIACAIRAFLRLEVHSYASGFSWFEEKMQIIRDAIRAYLQNPKYTLAATA